MIWHRLLLTSALGVCLPLAVWAQSNETPFQAETRLITQSMPCKWVSMGGRTGPSYGSGRFDFSCKGGTWGTVTLLLDQASFGGGTLSQVRFGYRDWDPAVNPTAGEASVAEQFLQYVLNRYVPATEAARLRSRFWAGNEGRISEGDTKAEVKVEEGPGYVQRWLIITRPQANSSALNFTTAPNIPAPWRQPADGGLLQVPATQAAQPIGSNLPQAPVNLPAPTPATQEGVRLQAPLQVPADAPAGPREERGAAPKSFLESAAETLRGITGLGTATDLDSPPPPAPTDFNRLNEAPPAQESLYRPTPPPPVSSSLVPSVEAVVNGRPAAPSNFAAYNEAERLTKEIEMKALEIARRTSSTETVPSQALQVAPIVNPAVVTPTAVPSTGYSAPSSVTPPIVPAASVDPRFAPSRELPQLKHIPKAEPVDTRNDVIRFEDEGSGL